ncbi:MAG: nuclear transport factor 2 family protein [Betaproteobacteria bacterium]|nr:MAG: nuclear transport factor 2 family protein [Betaproteobacteria bacterium]
MLPDVENHPGSPRHDGQMNPVATTSSAAADSWLRNYGSAWEQASPQAARKLFTEDCRYFETPFSKPAIGRDGVARYWQAVPDSQTDVAFSHEVLAIQGQTVIAHWSASFTRVPSGNRVKLDGVFVLEFTDAGLCSSLREWWHREETPST